ncbi:hypothetical protein M9434_000224 [Picochlorum sp. BPE23]|nr:hypothetical protein M9434_000224 [Picochlorum sp. BPE23]KAI8106254.1 hypothetical protein M9435_000800 [Picochlorum sp. BPE23]
MPSGGKKRKRRSRQLEAQYEKKSMRRAPFALEEGMTKDGKNKKQKQKNGGVVGNEGDAYMTAGMRKMLSMKHGAKKEHVPHGGETQLEETKGRKNGRGNAPAEGNKTRVQKETTTRPVEEEKEGKRSKARKKEFLRKRDQRKKTTHRETDDKDAHGMVSFGEQAEQPIKSNLKRRHWVEHDTPKPMTLSMRNVGSLMDSKALAALYKKSKRSNSEPKKATMDSLKKLLKASEVENNHN